MHPYGNQKEQIVPANMEMTSMGGAVVRPYMNSFFNTWISSYISIDGHPAAAVNFRPTRCRQLHRLSGIRIHHWRPWNMCS